MQALRVLVAVNAGAKGGAHLSGCAAENNRAPPCRLRIHAKALRLQPGGDCSPIRCRRAELLFKLPWRQPPVELGRAGCVLALNQLVQRLLLLGIALEHEHHVVQALFIGDGTQVFTGLQVGQHMAVQRDSVAFVNRVDHAIDRTDWLERRDARHVRCPNGTEQTACQGSQDEVIIHDLLVIGTGHNQMMTGHEPS